MWLCGGKRYTTNAIYTVRTRIEQALEVQKEVYLCFIDYTKAFDRVQPDEIITQLTQLKINEKSNPKHVMRTDEQCELMGKSAHWKK